MVENELNKSTDGNYGILSVILIVQNRRGFPGAYISLKAPPENEISVDYVNYLHYFF